ncbi:hypothetical protein BGZ63DRAFT_121227 [Mariannaea sp. PMI_226]|nr:hypothetical protein BGZ63DRAFT_121227 [Mariannaea sp. PMI_226]
MSSPNQESTCSDHESPDPSFIAMDIQERIRELKADKDRRMNAVVEEAAAAFADIRARYIDYENQRHNKERHRQAEEVHSILVALERQSEIQDKIEAILKSCFETTRLLENMILVGYAGREEDLKKCTK